VRADRARRAAGLGHPDAADELARWALSLERGR
jgi:hypothetical protein